VQTSGRDRACIVRNIDIGQNCRFCFFIIFITLSVHVMLRTLLLLSWATSVWWNKVSYIKDHTFIAWNFRLFLADSKALTLLQNFLNTPVLYTRGYSKSYAIELMPLILTFITLASYLTFKPLINFLLDYTYRRVFDK